MQTPQPLRHAYEAARLGVGRATLCRNPVPPNMCVGIELHNPSASADGDGCDDFSLRLAQITERGTI